MNIKLTPKIQHLLLIVVMLLNPILVSADALFSNMNTLNNDNQSPISANGNDSSTANTAEKHPNCHDKTSTSANQKTDKITECCEDLCECGASGCHASSVTVSANKSPFLLPSYSLNYLRDHYLSFVSSPSSPPPIA